MKKYKELRRNICLDLWARLSKLEDGTSWEDESISEEEFLVGMLEKYMPFKNQQQHEKWLDVLFGYKFWEDFEELTLLIINQ